MVIDVQSLYNKNGFKWDVAAKLKVNDVINGWIHPDDEEITVEVRVIKSAVDHFMVVQNMNTGEKYGIDDGGQFTVE